MKKFLRFAFISGGGWVIDFITYLVLTSLSFLPGNSNFVSSYAGVTFVWYASLSSVFDRNAGRYRNFVILYWMYQFFSILLYSKLLQIVFVYITNHEMSWLVSVYPEIVSKVVVTPCNLITNFFCMRLLTSFMPQEDDLCHVKT